MNKLSHIAELSLVGSLNILCRQDDIKPGRLKNKLDLLEKLADTELEKYNISKTSESIVKGAMLKFIDESGWRKRKISIGTFVSFIFAVVDDSENTFDKKLFNTIKEIFDYFERKEQFQTLCYSAGAIASGKWTNIKKEVFV